jgi:hypothetical protein
MIATAWMNGKQSAPNVAYGLKIQAADRDRYFQKGWKTVTLELEGYSRLVEVNVDKPSFWGPKCRELISKEIGFWFMENNLVPWPKRKPPKLLIEPIAGNRFSVRLPGSDD